MKTHNQTSSRPLSGKLIAFSALGAYFAVLCVGVLLNLAKGSVLETDFVVNLHPVTYAVAWVVLTATTSCLWLRSTARDRPT